MKLIIDIPEEQYNDIVKHLTDNDGNYAYSDFNLREIIRNGTPYNPTGDCISREALKAELEVYRHTRNYKSDEDEAQNALLDNVLEDIDNAQTVEAFTKEDMAGAYNEGYACGGRESKRPNEQIAWEQGYEAGLAQGKHDRPQGVWKLVYRDNQDIDIVCPFCNSIRFPAYSHGYTIEELEEYLIRQHLPNFCEDCGADLRKDGAEK